MPSPHLTSPHLPPANHPHQAEAPLLVPGLVVLPTAAYLLSPPLLALLGANAAVAAGNSANHAASVVAGLPPGSRVLLHALDLVHKSNGSSGGGSGGGGKRRRVASVVAGLQAALPRSVLLAAVGREGEGEGEEGVGGQPPQQEEAELCAWVVRAAKAMPLLRVEEDEGGGWLGLA